MTVGGVYCAIVVMPEEALCTDPVDRLSDVSILEAYYPTGTICGNASLVVRRSLL